VLDAQNRFNRMAKRHADEWSTQTHYS
jgi:hypothetical protein